jgi:hypothetical protein
MPRTPAAVLIHDGKRRFRSPDPRTSQSQSPTRAHADRTAERVPASLIEPMDLRVISQPPSRNRKLTQTLGKGILAGSTRSLRFLS